MWIKSKVVMLATNQKANVYLNEYANDKNKADKLVFGGNIKNELTSSSKDLEDRGYKAQHLYFLSDEEIKDCDWMINTNGDTLIQFKDKFKHEGDGSWREFWRKVIATTDSYIACVKDTLSIPQRKGLTNHYPTEKWILPQPSQSFLQVFVREYNKGNVIKEVLVEYSRTMDGTPTYNRLSVNPKDNTITIKKIKDSWSRGELQFFKGSSGNHIECIRQRLIHVYGENENYDYILKLKELSNWIEENL